MSIIKTWIMPADTLTESCEFGKRVLTSWAFSGLIIGVIIGIVASINGVSEALSLAIVGMPMATVIYGLMGVAFEKWGSKTLGPRFAWYWYVYPWVMLFVVAFSLTLGMVWSLTFGSGKK